MALLQFNQFVGAFIRSVDPKTELARRLWSKGQRGFTFRRRSGFTLVEVLVVLAIIGMVMGLAGPRVLNYLSDSKVKAARLQMENISSALDLFYLDNGRYPQTSEGLVALFRRPSNATAWNGPYLKGSTPPNDPWGHAFVYRSPGQEGAYEIASFGPEGREGSDKAIRRIGDGPR
ncbi:MAG: type II secretion system major pseudopilin GspG [Hyphomicrobiales bacterium]|nr:type II secretion system major pseudopilin GspG [Hyphomicrobiales bacterium]